MTTGDCEWPVESREPQNYGLGNTRAGRVLVGHGVEVLQAI